MFAIVAAGRDWSIGRNGGLLVHLPPDLKRFKKLTLGKAVIMGRPTLLTLPGSKPLSGRENYILSRDADFCVEGATVLHSFDEAAGVVSRYGRDDIACIGGAEIYKLLLPLTDYVLLTRIDADFPDADKRFPDLDALGWSREEEEEPLSYNGLGFQYFIYRKNTAI